MKKMRFDEFYLYNNREEEDQIFSRLLELQNQMLSPLVSPKFLSSGFSDLACLPTCPPVNKLDKG